MNAEINALAREIAERRSGRPAYLVDDETLAAALSEAEATYEPPTPLSPPLEAIRKAEGKRLAGDEVAESIGFLNRMSAAMRSAGTPTPKQD